MIEFLYQALSSRYGIVIHAAPAKLVRQRLYVARREHGDATLDRLQLRLSPTADDEIWIVKGEIDGTEKGSGNT